MPNLPYTTSGWSTHSEVNLRQVDYPLFEQGATAHYTVLRTYEGPAAGYSAGTIDTADAEFGSAYLVRQSPLIDIGGSCVRYERLFSTVPASWVDLDSYAYTYPGYEAGASSATVVANAIVVSGANIAVTTATDSGAIAGDSVVISVTYTRNGLVASATFAALAVATTNSSQVTVTRTLPGSGAFSSVSGTVAKSIPGVPSPRALVVGSRVIHDYALTSDSAIDTALPIAPLFSPLTSAGELAELLTTTSTPTAAAYRSLVVSSGEIAVECIRRRYLGNIYVRQTRMIPAR